MPLSRISTKSGSSPPVRGARRDLSDLLRGQGLIPARAGSTLDIVSIVTLAGAHPRPCGEHGGRGLSVTDLAGSSPPVRGAQIRLSCSELIGGLIPARAGSTVIHHWGNDGQRAHPRPCGEHPYSALPYSPG